jgi:hypothetical protein
MWNYLGGLIRDNGIAGRVACDIYEEEKSIQVFGLDS